ncbi:ComF family protein [Desertivirga xinjiangensis]|uniref:ComF family protein n=1 Tax=Desertivirga xinjiangensis TaxID=539206 RepID=UPI00210C5736|nr:ComF family protein [Pedobacter xinjiangensis]
MNAVYRHLSDFVSLFFPEVCAGCGASLVSQESVLCSGCIFHLPYTNFHLDKSNRVARQFWGRVTFRQCSAYLYFSKGSKVQNLMHQLKYNNRPEVGFKLGDMYGKDLKEASGFEKPDLIIPVPLHPARQRKRGYNQSDYFAEGLSKQLACPFNNRSLKRGHFTESQTRKSRFVRYENMKDVFMVNEPELLKDKHILLVDDIITTGATIESCANALLTISNTKISIASIAFTE